MFLTHFSESKIPNPIKIKQTEEIILKRILSCLNKRVQTANVREIIIKIEIIKLLEFLILCFILIKITWA